MPLYEYTCKACGHEWDLHSPRMTSPPDGLVECPKCGSKDAERVFSLPTVVLKGTGWTKQTREGE